MEDVLFRISIYVPHFQEVYSPAGSIKTKDMGNIAFHNVYSIQYKKVYTVNTLVYTVHTVQYTVYSIYTVYTIIIAQYLLVITPPGGILLAIANAQGLFVCSLYRSAPLRGAPRNVHTR